MPPSSGPQGFKGPQLAQRRSPVGMIGKGRERVLVGAFFPLRLCLTSFLIPCHRSSLSVTSQPATVPHLPLPAGTPPAPASAQAEGTRTYTREYMKTLAAAWLTRPTGLEAGLGLWKEALLLAQPRLPPIVTATAQPQAPLTRAALAAGGSGAEAGATRAAAAVSLPAGAGAVDSRAGAVVGGGTPAEPGRACYTCNLQQGQHEAALAAIQAIKVRPSPEKSPVFSLLLSACGRAASLCNAST